MNKKVLIVSSAGFPKEEIQKVVAGIPSVELIISEDNQSSLGDKVSEINALIACPRFLFSKELLSKAGPTLEWIHASGAGCEEFMIPELVQSNIVLTNGKIIQGPEVADHALALLLALTRNLNYILRGTKGSMPRPVELRGKTAVVVGVGGVGMLTAERLHAFGMRVLGVDQEYKPMVRAIEEWYLSERLYEALALADAVVLCVPSTRLTRKMFGKKEFSAMKSSAYFINVCRGTVVDTDALTNALRQGKIKAAGLDVTDPEPLPEDHPLRRMFNVVISPHIAGPSDQNRYRGWKLIRENVERFAKNLPLLNVVDKERGY